MSIMVGFNYFRYQEQVGDWMIDCWYLSKVDLLMSDRYGRFFMNRMEQSKTEGHGVGDSRVD